MFILACTKPLTPFFQVTYSSLNFVADDAVRLLTRQDHTASSREVFSVQDDLVLLTYFNNNKISAEDPPTPVG